MGSAVTRFERDGEPIEWECLTDDIVVPSGIDTISGYAFKGASHFNSVEFPDTLTRVDQGAFYGCRGLTSLVLPDSVTQIGHEAFRHCSGLTSITLPKNLSTVDANAFAECKGITSIVLPDSVTSVNTCAFFGCSAATSLVIPDSVRAIKTSAFRNCAGLTTISLPRTLVDIDTWAFHNCTGVTSLFFRPRASRAFIAWVVGGSRKRDNWQVTTLKQLRNVLLLVTLFAFEAPPELSTLDPDGSKGVFVDCAGIADVVPVLTMEEYTALQKGVDNIYAGLM